MGWRNLMRRMRRRFMTELGVSLLDAQDDIAKRTLPKFANDPKNVIIDLPRRLIHPERMTIGDHVWLGPGSFIAAVVEYPSPSLQDPARHQHRQEFSPTIRIADRVTSSGNLIIGAVDRVEVDEDVMFAFNVTVLDNLHGFENAYDPYKYQRIQRIAPVSIGRGCWIGQNAVILPSVEIGEMTIVGANSVVTHSVPPRSIVVGAPARVIKKWDDQSGEWRGCRQTARVRAGLR